MGFSRVQVPAHGFKSQSEENVSSWSSSYSPPITRQDGLDPITAQVVLPWPSQSWGSIALDPGTLSGYPKLSIPLRIYFFSFFEKFGLGDLDKS